MITGAFLRLACVAATLWCVAVAASAQSLRAVEYPGFSRIIIPLSESQPWSLSRGPRQVSLVLPGADGVPEAGDVFARMARTRVLSVEPRLSDEGGVIDIGLACDCAVEATRIGPGLIAIDVRRRDGTDAEGPDPVALADQRAVPTAGTPAASPGNLPARAPAVADPGTGPTGQVQSDQGAANVAEGQSTFAPILPLRPPPSRPPSSGSDSFGAKDRASAGGLAALSEELEPDVDPRETLGPNPEVPAPAVLDQLRLALTRDLEQSSRSGTLTANPVPAQDGPSRGASTELSEYSAPLVSSQPSNPDRTPDGPATLSRRPPLPPAPGPGIVAGSSGGSDPANASRPQLRIHDGTVPPDDPDKAETAGNPDCPPTSELDIAAWYEPERAGNRLPELRRMIVAPSGDTDPEAALALARFYLALGFGDEARMVARSFGLSGSAAEAIRDLSLVLDGRDVPSDGILSRSTGCSGAASLWRIAAGLPAEDSLDVGPVVEVLSGLPPPIRHVVGPALARNLAKAGHAAAADAVNLILDRTPGARTAAGQLLKAETLEAEGLTGEAAAAYAEIVEDGSPLADQALARVALIEHGAGTTAQDDLRSDLEIARRQAGRTTDVQVLAISLAVVAARNGDLDDALGVLNDIAQSSDPSAVAEARRVAVELLMDHDPAETGLAAYADALLRHRALLEATPAGRATLRKAAQTIEMAGLPNLARDMVGSVNELGDVEGLLAAARADLSGGNFSRVLEKLGTLQGPEAMRLRARALEGLGDYAGAFAEVYGLPVDDADRVRIASLSGNLSEIPPDQSPSARLKLRAFPAGQPGSGSGAPSPSDSAVALDPTPDAAPTDRDRNAAGAGPGADEGPVVPSASDVATLGGAGAAFPDLSSYRALIAGTQELKGLGDAALAETASVRAPMSTDDKLATEPEPERLPGT